MDIEIIRELQEKSRDLRILYVEDDDNIRSSMVSMMKKFLPEVTTATNGEEGLQRYRETPYDLVITDIAMPRLDGKQMLQEIKRDTPSQYTMVTSAYGDKEHLLDLINLGVTKFIPKPISAAYFVQSVHEVITNIYNARKVEEYHRMLKERLVESTSILEQYKEAVDISSIVSKASPEGTITFVNDAFCTISGYSRDELIGQNHRIIRSPHMKDPVFQELWETITAKKVWSGELENRKKNGESYYTYSTIIPILNVEGSIIEFISIHQDISELKKAQLEKLSSSIDKAMAINAQEMVEQIPLAALIVDAQSAIVHKNALFDKQTLYEFSEGDDLREGLESSEGDALFDWEYCGALFDDTPPSVVAAGQRFRLFVKALQHTGDRYLICLIPDESGE